MRFDANTLILKAKNLGLPTRGKPDYNHLHRVRIQREEASNAQQWCEDNFGNNWIWSSPTQTNYSDFYFRTTEDALAFKLRFTPA